MAQSFKVPSNPKVTAFFLVFAAAVASATVWSFRSGFFWTGICLIVVAAPLAMLYWWMLYMNPARTRVIIEDKTVMVEAPPFYKASIPAESIQRAFIADIPSEPAFASMQSNGSMAYFGYRSGAFKTTEGKDVLVASRSDRALCLDTQGRYYLLGPKDLDGLAQAVGEFVAVKGL